MVGYCRQASQNPFRGWTRPVGRMLPTPGLDFRGGLVEQQRKVVQIFLIVLPKTEEVEMFPRGVNNLFSVLICDIWGILPPLCPPPLRKSARDIFCDYYRKQFWASCQLLAPVSWPVWARSWQEYPWTMECPSKTCTVDIGFFITSKTCWTKEL